MDYHRSICACSIDSVSTTYNANTVSLIANLSYRPFGIANGMDTGSGGTVANVFDQSGRLTVANPGADKERTYTYDAVGNLTSVDSPSVAWYNRVFGYDVLNRLEHAEGPWGITYNGLGQRVIKTVDGVTTVFHYDFKGNIIAESDENGSFVYEYLYKGGSRLALVDVASGEIFSFLNDRLGTPQMLADSTNTIVWEGIYKPFGEAEVNPNSSVVNNFRFAGQYYDEETGFHYNYHRYYDPHTGRYLRVDPLGLDGGINLYVYAGLNPINLIDSCGLTFDPVDLYDPSKPFSR